VDGIKAFHGRRLGLRLTPDWPLDHWSGLAASAVQPTGEPVPAEHLGGLLGHRDERPAAVDSAGQRLDHRALLAAAWGRPARRDGSPVIRLPGPPYLFVSRIREVRTVSCRVGSGLVAEYDLPGRAWFWEQNGDRTAPLPVLVEIASQPCSWLMAHLDLAQEGTRLRNLGGVLTVHRELPRSAGIVQTTVHLTDISESDGTTTYTFDVACQVGDEPLLSLTTTFGLLPAGDTGWPPVPAQAGSPPQPGETLVDLRTRPRHLFGGRCRLPGPMLLMIDRVTGCRPDGGAAGLGWLRAEKDVGPGDWYFKAHFFQDPVLPGSLALAAMAHLVQLHLLRDGPAGAHFETPRAGGELTWSHHGAIRPAGDRMVIDRMVIDVEITATGSDATGRFAVADGRIWAGGLCVCRARGVAVRMVAGGRGKAGADRQKGENAL
jgi:3-hydroxymyristoyl/3-hydroxydecanoyl-(acyl carrier protein) dehydratase